MLFDSFLGLDAEGHFTETMTLYTTISQKIYGHFLDEDCYFPRPGFTLRELEVLRLLIRKFKKLTKQFLGKFEKHGLDAHKVHLLDHVYEDLIRMGAFLMMAADSWEAAHKRFKEAFRGTSKRTGFFLPETIEVLETRANAEHDFASLRETTGEGIGDETLSSASGSVVEKKSLEAIAVDSAALASTGVSMTLEELALAASGRPSSNLKAVRAQGSGLQHRPNLPTGKRKSGQEPVVSTIRQLAEEIGSNGVELLTSLIADKVADMRGVDDSLPGKNEDMTTNADGIPWHSEIIKNIRVSTGRVVWHQSLSKKR